MEMIAGKVFPRSLSKEPWPEPSKESLELWMTRHPSFKTFSSHYMDSQRRILFLADVKPELRFQAFENVCLQRNLAPTTAETYWTTWLGIQKALGIRPSEADARVTKILKARAVAYPVKFPIAVILSEMELFVTTFKDALPSLAAIGMFAFLHGQRISDMIQLAVADLQINDSFLMVTVRRGKTMSVSQPYTLWMRRNVYPAETLIKTATEAKAQSRLFLFSDFNQEEERQKVLSTIRDMLTSINDQLELRSFRRGGLQRMAQQGFKMETVLQFSRHSDVAMLMRYLGWGQHAEERQSTMIEVLDATTTKMNCQEAL